MEPREYLGHDATDLADLVARKEVTAAELLALARGRRDAGEPDAQRRRRRPRRGSPTHAPPTRRCAGPFAGVPFLVKDLGQEYAGFPTSNGSRALAHDVADRHALVTQRFLDAGLVIFGKTNTPEFGAKGVTESELWGAGAQPVEHRPHARRVLRRLGRGGRGGHRTGGGGQRRRRLGADPGRLQRAGRPEDQPRPRAPTDRRPAR